MMIRVSNWSEGISHYVPILCLCNEQTAKTLILGSVVKFCIIIIFVVVVVITTIIIIIIIMSVFF